MNARADFSEALSHKLAGILSADDLKACEALTEARSGIVADIVSAVSMETGIKPQAIYSNSRRQRVAFARQLVMYVAHRHGVSHSAIGRALGRDHSTIMHGIRAEAKRRGEL